MKDQMNDSEDYLWDRSGDADPEIQNLENMLGSLRYQPRPLAIPKEVEISRPSFRRFGSRLAIAATILLAIGAGALWLTIEKRKQPKEPLKAAAILPDDVRKEIPQTVPEATPESSTPDPTVAVNEPGTKPDSQRTTGRRNRNSQTAPSNQRQVPGPAAPVLAANELREAEEGKARLMLALRYASTKLNVALKKSQGTNNRNLMHNQHRIG